MVIWITAARCASLYTGNNKMFEKSTYRVGERVRRGGQYVCVPCGYKRIFAAGEVFPPCINCMRVSRPVSDDEFEEAALRGDAIDEFDNDAVAPNFEVWELVEEL